MPIILATAIIAIASMAFAASSVSFQGRITKADGTALESSGVSFKVDVLSSGNGCILYEETFTKDMTGSSGAFSLTLGDGTGTRADGNTWSMIDALSNSGSFDVNSSQCTSGSGTVHYAPSADDERQILISFKESSGTWDQMPVATLTHSPYAIESRQVSGFPATSLLRVANSGVAGTATALTSANFTELFALLNGTSTQYASNTSSAGTKISSSAGTPASAAVGSVWYDTTSGTFKYKDGSGVQTFGTGGGGGLTSVGLTMPSDFTVTTSPLTSNGTLAVTYATQSANTVLAGPNTGSAAAPGYRALVAADLPSSVVLSGGNTVSATMNIGSATGSSQDLNFVTAGNTRMTVASGGNVGIGTATPTALLHSNASDSNATTAFTYLGPNGSAKTVSVNNQATVTSSTKTSGLLDGNYDALTVTPSAASTATYRGRQVEVQTPSSSTFAIGQLMGLYLETVHAGSGTAGTITGFIGGGFSSGTAAVTSIIGATINSGLIGVGNQTAAVTNVYGVNSIVQNGTTAGTITNRYGLYAAATNSGTVTSDYGLYLTGFATGGTHTNTGFDVYAADTGANNYFGGNVGIGSTGPATALDVSGVARANSLSLGGNNNPNGKLVATYDSTINGALSATATIDSSDNTSGTYSLYLRSKTGSGTVNNTMVVRGDGLVGIGTVSPLYALHVFGTTWSTVATRSGGSYSTNPVYLGPNGSGSTTGVAFPAANQLSLVTNGVEAIRMDTAGKVGIGTTTPGYTLHVVGTAGLSTGTAWTNASDLRLKDIEGDYDHGLDEVLQLHTVRYHYKKDNALGLPSDFSKTGFIAQEVQKVIPEAVITRKDGYLELNVDPIHWAVVNAIKEFYQKWFTDSEALHQQLAEKDQRIQSLEQSNQQLKSYLCAKDPGAPFCH